MFAVHQQTIRLYEKEGLITPKRSSGGTRMFTEEDISKLEEIIYLTNKLGVNIAGVNQILKLKKQINKLQGEMNKLFDQTQDQLDEQAQSSQTGARESLQNLMMIKKQNQPLVTTDQKSEEEVVIDSWELDYEE